jgi:hypothetical protein
MVNMEFAFARVTWNHLGWVGLKIAVFPLDSPVWYGRRAALRTPLVTR